MSGFKNDGISSKWSGHDVLAVERARRRRSRVPDFCLSCALGEHRSVHTEGGCTANVGPEPRDFVCRCVKPGPPLRLIEDRELAFAAAVDAE